MTLSFHHAQHRVPEMGELLSPFSALRLQQRREQAINLLLMPIPSHDRHRHHKVLQLRMHLVPQLPPLARLRVHRLFPLRLALALLYLPLLLPALTVAPAACGDNVPQQLLVVVRVVEYLRVQTLLVLLCIRVLSWYLTDPRMLILPPSCPVK